MRCRQELCKHWSGDGNVCPCAVFGMEPNGPDWVDPDDGFDRTAAHSEAAAERAEQPDSGYRDKVARALEATHLGGYGKSTWDLMADEVLAVRDAEMERLRERLRQAEGEAAADEASLDHVRVTLVEELDLPDDMSLPDALSAVATKVDAAYAERDQLRASLKYEEDRSVEVAEEMRQLRADLAEARGERDLAVAHDQQPYPTAWAYEQACKALRRKTALLATAIVPPEDAADQLVNAVHWALAPYGDQAREAFSALLGSWRATVGAETAAADDWQIVEAFDEHSGRPCWDVTRPGMPRWRYPTRQAAERALETTHRDPIGDGTGGVAEAGARD